MKKKKIKSFRILCFLGILLIPVVIYFIHKAKKEKDFDLIISCNNHERFLRYPIRKYIEKNNIFPYDKKLPGYAFFAEFTSQDQGVLNCHHGAPNAILGGWQYVNLPPDVWDKVIEKWGSFYDNGMIPFYWCGRPTGLKSRVAAGVWGKASFSHQDMKEEELKERLERLNRILTDIGEKPVSLNVPKGIDWNQYKKKELENKKNSTNGVHPSQI